MAARFKIIVLTKDASDPEYRYVFWGDVPVARQPFYANAAATSQWKDAIAGDLTSLQNGSVVERTGAIRLTAGSSLAQVQAELVSRWTAFQDEITNTNLWIRYGTTWDGTTWAAGGVS